MPRRAVPAMRRWVSSWIVLPAAVQIVLSSRHDPGLPVARLRAHGDLTELRARDLSISFTQAGAFLRQAGVQLNTSDVRRLNKRTEGWLAGLSLAAIVLKEQPDPQRFVREFSGDTRHVFDYLARDVLATANPDVLDFMVHSSVLERLYAPLCDAVLERSDSASMLAEVDRANYFLVPLDASGSDYRYHHLFAEVLRRQLDATDPDSVPGLHARASLWFEDHGDIEHAIEHAIASRDVARASRLVMQCGRPVRCLWVECIRSTAGSTRCRGRRRSATGSWRRCAPSPRDSAGKDATRSSTGSASQRMGRTTAHLPTGSRRFARRSRW